MTLATVQAAASARLYPRHVLEGCESALVLFAAAFYGQQDAIWMAEAGIAATCVDVDAERLGEMETVYPPNWEYVYGDAFAYATTTTRTWDIVSIDCPSNLFDRCAELLPLWCRLARRAVILGTGKGTILAVPAGWRVTDELRRSSFVGGVYWTVLQPC